MKNLKIKNIIFYLQFNEENNFPIGLCINLYVTMKLTQMST